MFCKLSLTPLCITPPTNRSIKEVFSPSQSDPRFRSLKVREITKSQITQLFKQRGKGAHQEFEKMWDEKKERADIDYWALRNHQISISDLAYGLKRIIEQANQCYHELCKENFSETRVWVRNFWNTWQVSGFAGEQKIVSCELCREKVQGPPSYKIQNLKTRKVLNISPFSLHLIQAHHDFARLESSFRVDPIQACHVLSLIEST